MGKHYALSDLHGCYDYLSEIKSHITREDTVFFLGDAADRGSQGWDCIKSIRYNPNFIYLCGNHEDMLRKAMIEYFDRDSDLTNASTDLLMYNGGMSTFNEWIEEGAKHEWISFLESLPLNHIYINTSGKQIILTHAGYTPTEVITHFPLRKSLLWSREHFHDNWKAAENTYIVHGHTPTPNLARCICTEDYDEERDFEFGALHYCDGHKICIDNGTVWTGNCTLFDLDTFESIIFKRGYGGVIECEIKENV